MRIQIQSFMRRRAAAAGLAAMALCFSNSLLTACGDGAKKEKDRAHEEENKIFKPEQQPSYVSAIDLKSSHAVCDKASEIAGKTSVSVVSCEVENNIIALDVSDGNASVPQTFDVTERAEVLFEKTRGLTPQNVNMFYKQFLFSVWLSQPK